MKRYLLSCLLLMLHSAYKLTAQTPELIPDSAFRDHTRSICKNCRTYSELDSNFLFLHPNLVYSLSLGSTRQYGSIQKVLDSLILFQNLVEADLFLRKDRGVEYLPDAICQLPKLTYLKMWGSDINELHLIGRMKRLRYLDMQGADIDDRTIDFSQMDSLRWVDLYGCFFTTIPKSMCLLKHLEVINVSANPIEKLPEEIQRLKSLRWLNLGSTLIKEIPSSLANLPKLNWLNLCNNNIKKLPDRLYKIKSLTLIINSKKNYNHELLTDEQYLRLKKLKGRTWNIIECE